MKKGETIVLEIRDVNNIGCGIGTADDGRVVFVKGAVTGETIEGLVIKDLKHYGVARLLRVLKPSPYRIDEDPCNVPLACGGCVYRKITYELEKEIKQGYVDAVFHKVQMKDVNILPVISTGQLFGYRNKAQYPVVETQEGIRAGFYAPKSHFVVPAERCQIQNLSFGDVVEWICGFATEHFWTAYRESTKEGMLRHLYLRIGEVTGELMVTLVINGKELPDCEEFVSELTTRFPQIVSVMLNVNEKATNVILGKEFKTLYGRDYIEDELCGLRFCLSADSFYQVNRRGAEMIYQKAIELAQFKGDEVLMDLYCGTGTIGLAMSKYVSRVIGVEIVRGAVECAKKNAERNGVTNAEFYCADASKAETILQCAGGRCPDVVVLDPPRKGCSRPLIKCLGEELKVPKIVYVSCEPDTLARDCSYFADYGYVLGDVQPFDMFPRTGHVESVVCLTRK